MNMKEMAPGVYEVASDSDARRTYVVNLTGPYGQCTCTHWAIQRNRAASKGQDPPACKHVRAAQTNGNSAAWRAKQAELEAERARLEEQLSAEKKAKEDAKRDKMASELQKMIADMK